MTEGTKTLAFLGTAAALAAIVLLSAPGRPSSEVFDDQGKEFFPDFKDPNKAASLEVVDYSEATGRPRRFKVQIQGGKGSIPSHHNYPADAKERLVNTASAVIDLRKDKVQSPNSKDHEALGVVDPLDDQASGNKGRGQRVTLRDGTGNVLADFIFGKKAPGERDQRYLRVPGQKRTYALKTKVEITTKFEDWIETDLLQLTAGAIRKIDVDSYSYDEQAVQLKNRSHFIVQRDDSSGPWKISEMKDTEEPHTENIGQMTGALDDLRIVGVRPKPPILTRDLKFAGEFKVKERMTPEQVFALRSLQGQGYYFLQQGKEVHLISNEGEVQVSCDDGVIYTLRFGEVAPGSDEELTAGAGEPPKEEKKDEKKEEKKPLFGGEHRYLLVTARFDAALLGASPAEPRPYAADPAKKPEDQKVDEEKAKKEKEEFDKKKGDFDKKVADGKKRADSLTDRFSGWYYVISADYFKKLRKPRTDLIKAKPVPEKKPEDPKPPDKPADPPKPPDKPPDEKKPSSAPPKEGAPEGKPEPPKPTPELPKPPDPKKPPVEAPKPPEKPK